MRIVSLCPSNTEILFAINAGADVVAVEKWADYPLEAIALPKVGTELDVDMDLVASHKPDLVLASLTVPGMEKTVKALRKEGLPHLVLNPQSLEDIFQDIAAVGEAVERKKEAGELVCRMQEQIDKVRMINPRRKERAGLYLEWWPKPAITPGGRCWTKGMIEAAGGKNIFEGRDVRSGRVEYHEVAEKNPDLILLCWCGIEREKIDPKEVAGRENWNRIRAVKKGRIHALEEGWYGRPGPRVVYGIQQMARWIAALE